MQVFASFVAFISEITISEIISLL